MCVPLEVRTRPGNPVVSQFSIPWGVAAALAKGRVATEHFTETAIRDPEILEVSGKISVEMDPGLNRPDRVPPGKLKIIMKDGQVLSKQVDDPLGSPERPMSFDDCVKKFRDCSSNLQNGFSKERAERIIELIGDLEQMREIGEITQLLRPE